MVMRRKPPQTQTNTASSENSEPALTEEKKPEPTPEKIKFTNNGWGPGLGQMLDVGDKFTFTRGAETYTPVSYFPYTVGPFSVTITLREGEGLDEFCLRAQRFLNTVFEAEFEIQSKQWVERMGDSGKHVPGKSGK